MPQLLPPIPLGGDVGGSSSTECKKSKNTQRIWTNLFDGLCSSTEALPKNINWVFKSQNKELLGVAWEKCLDDKKTSAAQALDGTLENCIEEDFNVF